MHDAFTTVSLVLLTLLALAGSVAAIGTLMGRGRGPAQVRSELILLAICTVGSAILLVYRVVANGAWRPLDAHVDGLVLLATLFGAAVLFLHTRPMLRGLIVFALPLVTIILAWAICASMWTFRQFQFHDVWATVHVALAYCGAIFLGIAAIGGVMYLYVQRRLRQKQDLPSTGTGPADGPGAFGSLEAIERLIIRAAAIGFTLLTLVMIMGLIEATAGPTRMGPGWWHSPKVVLTIGVWLIYALVMNVRHATVFRGSRAAWLSIAGMVLLLAVFGIATAMGGEPKHVSGAPQPSIPVNTTSQEAR